MFDGRPRPHRKWCGSAPNEQVRFDPLHLAVQNTGKSNSGSDGAKDEQGRIITLLLEHGASPGDADTKGKTVAAAASSDWIRAQLDTQARRARRLVSTRWESLTPTENEVVRLAAEGLRNAEIASRLFVTTGTVKTHLAHIFAKLGVTTRAELVARAARHGHEL